MIKQANSKDIPVIEDILLDAVNWMHSSGLDNLWDESNIKWSHLSKNYKIDEFYIAYKNDVPISCMALTQYDATYWTDVPKGESFYLHKLAVKRAYAGKGVSNEMITYAKHLACKYNVNKIHLDCNQHRKKLRELYENSGFVCVKEINHDNYGIALYVCDLVKISDELLSVRNIPR